MLTRLRTCVQIEHYIRAMGHNLQVNRKSMTRGDAPFMTQFLLTGFNQSTAIGLEQLAITQLGMFAIPSR